MRLHRRGFTLIEMVIVMAMLGAVLTCILSLNVGVIGRIRDISVEVKKGREGPAIVRLIEDDLINAYADGRMEKLFEGKSGGSSSEVRFVTSRDSVLFLQGFQSDLTETGYKIESNREAKGSIPLYTLYRREDFSMDDTPTEGGVWIPVADNVVSFALRFYDLPEEGVEDEEDSLSSLRLGEGNVESLETWDSENRWLPYAVRVELSLDIREAEYRNDPSLEADGVQHFVGFVRLPPFSRNLEQEEDRVNLRLNPRPAQPNQNQNN